MIIIIIIIMRLIMMIIIIILIITTIMIGIIAIEAIAIAIKNEKKSDKSEEWID